MMIAFSQFVGGHGTSLTSPYRAALVKFLNADAPRTIEFFIRNLWQKNYALMFQYMLKYPEAEPLRRELMKKWDMLVAWTINADNSKLPPQITQQPPNPNTQPQHVIKQTMDELRTQGITLIHVLSSADPTWLSSNPPVVRLLIDVWDNRHRYTRNTPEEETPLPFIEENKLLVECLIQYCRVERRDALTLWKIISVFETRSLIDFTFVADYLKNEVALGYSEAEMKVVMREFMKHLEKDGKEVRESHKIKALELVLVPALAYATPVPKEDDASLGAKVASDSDDMQSTSSSSPQLPAKTAGAAAGPGALALPAAAGAKAPVEHALDSELVDFFFQKVAFGPLKDQHSLVHARWFR